MGEAKLRHETPLISVLVPYRGKPDALAACIKSLLATPDARIEVLVAYDDDDDTRQMALGLTREIWDGSHIGAILDSRLRSCLWERPPTLGEKLNKLSREARGDILWFIAQDYTIEGIDWPTRFREAVQALPSGVGVLFPKDDQHPDHASFPLITRQMMEITGFFMAPWFPYWFIDTWWDELGVLSGIHREIDVTVQHQGSRGRSIGIRDLKFWLDFFEHTRVLRAKDAREMCKIAGLDVSQLVPRMNECGARIGKLHDPAMIAAWEANSEGNLADSYAETKEAARVLMESLKPTNDAIRQKRATRVALCVPSTNSWCAPTATAVAALSAYSAMQGIDLMIINLQGSMITASRNNTVQAALAENMDYLMWIDSDMVFPPDALHRLLAHDKDIVGATYNKKVAPYETLGRLLGEPPPGGMGDVKLWPAATLPGGMMLVKADVYRAIQWPAYFETYRWGMGLVDGFEAFKIMMRNSFGAVPSEEALDALADSELAAWLRQQSYLLGENGEPHFYFSEDLNFCRKARRAGFKIHCDLELTYQMVHLGTNEVTCKPPPALAQAAE